jgi:hypothetical protein
MRHKAPIFFVPRIDLRVSVMNFALLPISPVHPVPASSIVETVAMISHAARQLPSSPTISRRHRGLVHLATQWSGY